MHLRERALNALAFQKRTPKKNVGFLTRARLESRNVPSTVAGRHISSLPCFWVLCCVMLCCVWIEANEKMITSCRASVLTSV